MAETVLLSTHDLALAGELQGGFHGGGYGVELLTPGEDPSNVEDPVLLVTTGGRSGSSAGNLAERALHLGLPVLMVVDKAEQVPPGATPFLRPANPEEIVVVGLRAIEHRRVRDLTGIVGDADAMLEVLERMLQIAPVDVTVLITGESGTGKELVARGIHLLSRRRHKPFIPVNVAALSATLLESELFGHEKGAFTGAIDSRKGLFELAQGGTIFLDEIGEMPIPTQTKLLRVIEQREFHRVGGQKLVRVNVRILAATNQELPYRVGSGDFRKDLYYRLNVLNISLPPLRQRPDDIPLLVDAFVREAKARHDRDRFRGITAEAMEVLLRHRWPGNVRELRNLIESMVVLAPGREIRPEDIPSEVRYGRDPLAMVRVEHEGTQEETETGQPMRRQMEFVFRTLMDMKVDIEDLKRDFESFRARERGARVLIGPAPDSPGPGSEVIVGRSGDLPDSDLAAEIGSGAAEVEGAGDVTDALGLIPARSGAAESAGSRDEGGGALENDLEPLARIHAVGYRDGMTLEDMECEVIQAALDSVKWNRRRASRKLGIGERTLYRKVKKYGLTKGKKPDGH